MTYDDFRDSLRDKPVKIAVSHLNRLALRQKRRSSCLLVPRCWLALMLFANSSTLAKPLTVGALSRGMAGARSHTLLVHSDWLRSFRLLGRSSWLGAPGVCSIESYGYARSGCSFIDNGYRSFGMLIRAGWLCRPDVESGVVDFE